MIVKTITVGPFEVNCYVVRGKSSAAFIVDPGADAQRILDEVARNDLRVVGYLLTHGHADHVGALAEVERQYPAPIYLHPADARWAFTPANQIPPYYAEPEKPKSPVLSASGEDFSFGAADLIFRIIETPGHTPGGVCFWFPEEKVIFSGDTLFCGSVGRTDLPGGNAAILQNSLKKLTVLPEETRVFPGHGPATTIGAELRDNFFLSRLR